MVAVDVSGRAFRRMSLVRRSMLEPGGKAAGAAGGCSSAGTGRRRARSRRRNTIAGTDRREIRRALAGESQEDTDGTERPPNLAAVDDSIVGGSRNDSQKNKDSSSSSESKKSHFNSLKQWGKGKLKLIKGNSSNGSGSRLVIEASEESNIYETVTLKGKMADLKNEKKACSTGSNLPISTQSGAMNLAVKLRQRQARTGKDDALHSSSGNWSASSESGRASIGSETTHQPKSTTTLSSAATSSNSLNHHPPSSSVSSRRKFLNTSTSSSVSEGTLTPDIVSDFAVPFADDGETSSIYSCDTEGYYTSFHLDSGLKTLKEEEPLSTPQTPLHSTSALSNSPGRGNTLTAENEYELFGKGSTSTTTSSAGTVCTTLLVSNNESCLSLARGPTVPERKSSLDQKQNDAESTSQMVIAMVHKQRGCETSESPDSGHNTSSSPVDSTSSPHGTLTGRSSEYEFSESDLEGVDRLERIRVKTTINSSRIPSMCVITPPPSDDETSLNQYVPLNRRKCSVPSDSQKRKSLLETDFGPDEICTQEKNISDLISNNTDKSQVCSTDQNIKQNHSLSVEMENKEVPRTLISSSARPLKVNPNYIYAEPNKKENRNSCQVQQDKTNNSKSSLIPPFNNVLGKMKEVLSSSSHKKFHGTGSLPLTGAEKAAVDAGDYVTISKSNETPPAFQQGASKESRDGDISPNFEMEYVSLNELPVAKSPTANILISPSNSLERKRRLGARVTLDSEGKVVYSSDSLRRNKGSHSTFEPGLYVKDTVSTPTASPLMVHRSTKLNIRPVTMTSHGINSASTKPISPVPDNKQARTVSPLSPKLGKVIIRAGSKTTSQVTSPASPVSCVSSDHPVSPQPSRGAYVKMKSPDELQQQTLNRGDTTLPVDSPNEEEGHTMLQTLPPQYKDPPSARIEKKTVGYSGNQDFSNKHWNLTRRFFTGTSQEKSYLNGKAKYFHPASTINQFNDYNFNSNANDVRVASKPGASLTSQVTPPFSNSAKQNLFKIGEEYCSQRTVRLPTPASIPLVPKSQSPQCDVKEMYRESVLSSTPTKNDKIHSVMEMSTVLSPIQKCEIDFNYKAYTNGSIPQKELQPHKTSCTSPNPTNTVSVQPKSSMTAEELFAAIHKSKKRMNIKGDFDNYGRSGSPSSVNSLSPGNSESSINGLKGIHCNENLRLGIENVSQNRHSWSPNARQALDFQSTLNQQVNFLTNNYKQSRASDRLGPPQQTSRHDFKRLLLQHGSKTNGAGSYRGKLSAVEQLRLSRQLKQNMPSSNSASNGGYMPSSPSDKRYNGPKLLPSPRSASSWRFASPRTDILSSTILEDCAEEERALSSQENIDQPLDLTASSHCSQEHVLNSTINNIHCINGLTSLTETFSRRQDTLKTFSSTLPPKSSAIQNHLALTKNFEEKPVVQYTNYNSLNLNKRHSVAAPLSPSNVKENVDTNQQCSSQISSQLKSVSGSLPQSQLANLRARQMFMNQATPLSKESLSPQVPSYKSPLASESHKPTSYSSRGSPARSILAEIERKSPARATLETAL